MTSRERPRTIKDEDAEFWREVDRLGWQHALLMGALVFACGCSLMALGVL